MKPAVGHEDPESRFRRTIARGRLASTYLLIGPEGVGKRTFAEGLAAALLCDRSGGETLEPCGACQSCHLTAAGSHPDLLRVARPEGKATLPLDLFLGPSDKRNRAGLCHDLALKPLVSDRRVAIIDDADHFSVEAANCLLKTLEEPPPRSLILLVGTSLSRQLPTIRSRSQVVRFGRLEPQQVEQVLMGDRLQIDAEEARLLAASCNGSVGRAIELREGSLGRANDALLARLNTPRLDPNALARVLEEESKAVGTEPRLRRRALREMLAVVVGTLHDRLRQSPEPGPVSDRLLGQLEACLEAEESLGRNANQSAVVQVLAARLASRCAGQTAGAAN